MMKKTLRLIIAASIIMLCACEKENYYHTMSLIRPLRAGVVMADQEYDTLSFYTTDNFQLISNAEWAVVPDSMKEGRIRNAYRNIWTVVSPIVFEANTTGQPRLGTITVRCFGDNEWDQTATANFYQLSWLDITIPKPKYSYNEGTITGAAFEAEDSATQITDTICFCVYDDWTLSDGSFVHPKETSGKKGQNKIAVDVEENPDFVERETTLTLTSRGVATPIKFKQEAKKEE